MPHSWPLRPLHVIPEDPRPIMERPYPTLAALAAVLLGALPSASALAAAPDSNVEWSGVSHVAWQDRRPLCPVDGESFAVRFQAWANDITSAQVLVTVGAVTTPVAAVKVATRGPYDVWQAQVPATAATSESYVIELTDGADTDYLGPAGVGDALPGAGFVLDFTTLEHAPVGATPVTGDGAVFKVWAPTRTTVHARGSFNGWGLGTPLAKVGEYFIGRAASGVADRAQYKYFFNNAVWNTDPRARSLNAAEGPYNARIENPFRYDWQVEDFTTPPFEQLVIYQLHVGTFAGRNDPAGATAYPSTYLDVAARVGHLAELGVNAVQLNPVNEFPGDESAGYNPLTAWAPEWRYGTPDQFKALVDSLHAHGIAVILDVVWNHFSTNDNFMWNYDGSQQWFDTPQVDTPWGAQADFDKAAIRDHYANSALHWLEEYRLDGFRMDATDYMNIPPQDAAGWALMQRANDEMDARWADKIAIAEQLPDDAWVTRPTGLGGAGFDSQYHDAFVDQLRQEIFDAAGGDPEMWRIRNIVQGSGQYLTGRHVLNYLQLHDEAWPSSGGQRMVRTIDTTAPHDDAFARGRMKLGLGLVMLAPGIPAMLMGDEWLEDTDFGASGTTRLDWSKKTAYASHFAYVRDLVALRRTTPALYADRLATVHHLNEAGNVMGFWRNDALGNPVVVVANFSNTSYPSYRVGVTASGNWVEALNSQAAAYGGPGGDNPGTLATEAVGADAQPQSLVISLPATSIVLLRPGTVVGVGDATASVPAGVRLDFLSPVPARGGASLAFTLPAAGPAILELLDVSGRRVARLAEGAFEAGRHVARWDGRDENGRTVSPGVYFVRLVTASGTAVRRVPVLH